MANKGKRTRKERRQLQAWSRDAECLAQEQVERDLEEEVRRLWKATRWYLGHEEWSCDLIDEETGEMYCGCFCNRYNRHALQQAIYRLRAWRTRREYWL